MSNPEQRARVEIDGLLAAAGWAVQDYKAAHINAARSVALREFEFTAGHGTAEYLLYVDGKACGVIEAKKQGSSLDSSWLRNESLADSGNLPPPNVTAQEIVDDLEAALERFRLIAANLAGDRAP